MTPAGRRALVAISAALLFAFAIWGFVKLPAYGSYPGPYGTVLNQVAPSERKLPNVITAVNFDYRALDTLGEEFILFAAVAGIALVLRHDRRETTDEPLPSRRANRGGRTDALRAFGALAIALTVAFGIYMAIHPHLTPGGGFQGGTLLAGWIALVMLGFGYRTLKAFASDHPLQMFEALGAGSYALIGIATLAVGGAFLANVLPLGGEGMLFASGTIPLINFFVAIEVLAGFMLVFLEFARETRREKPEQERE